MATWARIIPVQITGNNGAGAAYAYTDIGFREICDAANGR